MPARRFRMLKALVIVTMVASLIHFSDNAAEIAQYPEPLWITPVGIVLTWCAASALAAGALSRRAPDRTFFLLAGAYAALSIDGLLHYLFGSPMHMALRSNLTVLAEAFCGVVLAVALIGSAAVLRTNEGPKASRSAP